MKKIKYLVFCFFPIFVISFFFINSLNIHAEVETVVNELVENNYNDFSYDDGVYSNSLIKSFSGYAYLQIYKVNSNNQIIKYGNLNVSSGVNYYLFSGLQFSSDVDRFIIGYSDDSTNNILVLYSFLNDGSYDLYNYRINSVYSISFEITSWNPGVIGGIKFKNLMIYKSYLPYFEPGPISSGSYDDGYYDGYVDGQLVGYDDGYDDGYYDGAKESNPLFTNQSLIDYYDYDDIEHENKIGSINNYEIIDFGISTGNLNLGDDFLFVWHLKGLYLDTSIYYQFSASLTEFMEIRFNFVDGTYESYDYFNLDPNLGKSILLKNRSTYLVSIDFEFRDNSFANIISYQYNGDIYDRGYNNGVRVGKLDGYNEGKIDGYDEGYEFGYNDGALVDINTNGFKTLLGTIINYPIEFISTVFNFEIFGINLTALIGFIVSITLVAIIIKKFK